MSFSGAVPQEGYDTERASKTVFIENWRGQPLSFTLSFGEIKWFDEKGEIRRCDWSVCAQYE
jgi:hypothetical protein